MEEEKPISRKQPAAKEVKRMKRILDERAEEREQAREEEKDKSGKARQTQSEQAAKPLTRPPEGAPPAAAPPAAAPAPAPAPAPTPTAAPAPREGLTPEEIEARERFGKLDPEKKLTDAGFEVTNKRIIFYIPEGSRSRRSFLKKPAFLQELAKPEYDTPEKIKLACYKLLLAIIIKDDSINTNKWKVVNFQQSNAALKSEISRLEELIKEQERKAAAPPAAPTPAAAPTAAPATPTRPETKEEATARRAAEILRARERKKPALGTIQFEKPEHLESLSDEQLQTILDIEKAIYRFIETGSNEQVITYRITIKGKQLEELLKDTKVKKLKFTGIKPPLSWELGRDAGGFGKTAMDVINLIHRIKKKSESREEYRRFQERSRSIATEVSTNYELEQRKAEYLTNYEELVRRTYPIHDSVADLGEAGIRANWNRIQGIPRVRTALRIPPFGIRKAEVGRVSATIITEGFNNRVSFRDVFNQIDTVKINPELIPEEFLESENAFLDELYRLETLEKPTDKEKRRKAAMHEILVACLELLDAYQALRYTERPTPKLEEVEEKPAEALPEDQRQILDGLAALCNFGERDVGFWEETFARLMEFQGRAEREMTMSRMDGTTFTVDRGTFRRHSDPESALAILENRRGLYTIENGVAVFNEQAVTDEINRIIELGALNMILAEGVKVKPAEARARVARYKISNIREFSKFKPEQFRAFQLGFILDQSRRVEVQTREAKEELTRTYPGFDGIISRLLEEGVPPKQIGRIQEALLGITGITYDTAENRVMGAGIGVSINLEDGYTMIVGIGADREGNFIAGLGLKVEVFRNNIIQASVLTEIGLSGLSAGAAVTFKPGYVDIHTFAGIRWGIDQLIPTIGGGLGFSWDMQGQLERDLEAAEEGTDYAQLWKDWKEIPRAQIDKRFEAITKIPQIWNAIKPLMEEFALTKGDVVRIIEGIQEEITADVLADLRSPIPIFSYIGFGFVGPMPIPHIAVKLGEVQINIPNRREITRLTSEISDTSVTQQVEEALSRAETIQITRFVEKTPDLVYSRDGHLLRLERSDKIDLNEWATGIDTYNEALKETEIQLQEREDGRIELVVQKTDKKDIEIHIDPELERLALTVDEGRVYIDGDISDLIITRERFTFPFDESESGASIRDVITIRQRRSVEGHRDRTWIEKYEQSYIQMLDDESQFYIQRGNGFRRVGQYNIVDASQRPERIQGQIDNFASHRPDFETMLDAEEVREIEALLGERSRVLREVSFEELEIRAGFLPKLDKLIPETGWTDFKRKFRAIVDQPDKITQLIVQEIPNINERELSMAVTHLYNRWFSILYKQDLAKENLKKANKKLRKSLIAKINWVRDKIFIPDFRDAINRLGIAADPTTIAQQLIDDTYGPLLEKLKSPEFDFRTLNVDEIPAGAILLSGSWKVGGEGALAETVSYTTLPKREYLIHSFGFLEGTSVRYSPSSDIGRVLLEVASPIPEEDSAFLDSKLAIKIASLGAHALLAGNEDYRLITEIYANRTILRTSEKHQKALERFKKLVKDIREAQQKGQTFEVEAAGFTVRITMQTEIVGGAYAQCGNPSFYVTELGHVEVLREGNVVGVYQETHEVVDITLSKLFTSFGIGVGLLRTDRVVEPVPEGKHAEMGPAEQTGAEGKGPSAGPPTEADAAGGTRTVHTGPGSRGGGPSGR